MGILAWIVFGLIVGLLARALLPGRQKLSIVMTILLGVAGAFAGGLIATLLTDRTFTDFDPAGFIGSVLGAILLLVLVGWASRRRGVRAT